MAIPLPLLLGGAGILSSLLKSQQYYPAAEAPSRAQIYGDVLGSGIGGYLGGQQLGGGDPLGILGALGGGQQGGGPTVLNPPGQAALGSGDAASYIDFLTNGGFSGQGIANQSILALGQYTQPRNQSFGGLY